MNCELVFCLFDSSFSPGFLRSWINLCSLLNKKKVNYRTTQGNSCNAFYAKQQCFGGNVLSGPHQNPFQGRLKYQYLVFLEGNISFSAQDFLTLYDIIKTRDLDFLSASVDNRHKAIKKYDDELTLARYAEFDMTIVKHGVFEKLSYPWFRPHTSKNKHEQDLVDIGICQRIINEANTKILIADNVRIKRG